MQGAQWWWNEDGIRGGLDRYMPPSETLRSHMPEALVDGEAESPDRPEDREFSHEELNAEEAARRLEQMQRGKDLPA